MSDYEYRGLMAQAWDLLRGDYSNWPDRPFYRAIIERQGGPALDVGCGTGRLTLDYLSAGFDVDGVDNSPEMLDICRNKAAPLNIDVSNRLFQTEMDTLDLARKYATIFVPSSSFQLLTDQRAAAQALRRFHAHLAPGGILVMSIMSKLWPGDSLPPHMQWTDWLKAGQKARSQDGAIIRRSIRSRYDVANQLQHEENRYELLLDGEVIQTEAHSRIPAVRWYSQAQISAALATAAFTNIHLTAGFTETVATPTDTTFCVLGTRHKGSV